MRGARWGDGGAARWRVLLFLGVLVLILWSPNLLWLARSTLFVENRSTRPLTDVRLALCDASFSLGELKLGESRFRTLPSCGDASLSVNAGERELCRTYVEGDMYHVDVVAAEREIACDVRFPPFSPLFLIKRLL